MKIQKILKDKSKKVVSVDTYATVKEAAASVETKMDKWKVELLIVDAINTGKRAFGLNWKKIA